MKKKLSLILILFVCSFCFAQEADENVLNTNSKKTTEKTETLLQATKNNVRVTVEEIIPESENKGFTPNVNLIFYLPSLLGEVTGNSTYMGLRQDSSVVTSGTNFLLEGCEVFYEKEKFYTKNYWINYFDKFYFCFV